MSDKNGLIVDKEFESLVPVHSADELAGLTASIKEDGCRDALVVWKKHGVILDGMTRYRICSRRGIGFTTKQIDLPDRRAAKIWILNNQLLGRRNLTDVARIKVALQLKDEISAQAAERQEAARIAANTVRNEKGQPVRPISDAPVENAGKVPNVKIGEGRTDEAVGAIAGAGKEKVRNVETMLAEGTEKLQAAALAGRISASMAADAAKNACEELQDALADETITKDEFAEIRKTYPPLRQLTALQRLITKKQTTRQPGEDEDEHASGKSKKSKAPRESKTSVEEVALPLAAAINSLARKFDKAKVFAAGQLAPARVTQIVKHLHGDLEAEEWSTLRANVLSVFEAAKLFKDDMEEWK